MAESDSEGNLILNENFLKLVMGSALLAKTYWDKFSKYLKTDHEKLPNPMFLTHQIDFDEDRHSPYCETYFRYRKYKSRASLGLGVIGTVASLATGSVDVVGLAQGSRKLGKTSAHLVRLKKIQGKLPGTYLKKLCSALIRFKEVKLLLAGLSTAASVSSALGPITNITLTLAQDIGVSAATILGPMAAEQIAGLVCSQTAMELHWRAYLEYKLLGFRSKALLEKGKAHGPAMQMIRELFGQAIRLGESHHFETNQYILEPAGWRVVLDKMTLM